MSYYRYRKSYYRRPLYRTAAKKENLFDIYEYLRKEFLNADTETFRQIARFYRVNYGDGAYSYMLNTYNSWKHGYVGISSLTMGRILECVPKFLSPEKRLYILRCEIHNFIEKVKTKLKNNFNIDNLYSVYEEIQNEILNFNETNLHWFIGKNIFPAEQADYYLNVCKYALNERLIQSYKQVINDLSLIAQKFSSFNKPFEKATYKIDFINLSCEIKKLNNIPNFQSLNSFPLELEESFKKFGERYIFDELLKMNFYEKEGEINSMLKSKDIDSFFEHFLEITKGPNEIKMNSTFQGDGGVLTMQLEFMPFKKSMESILIAFSKVILIIGGGTFLTLLVINYKLYWIFVLGFYVVFYLIAIIAEESVKIYKASTQIRRYGKQ